MVVSELYNSRFDKEYDAVVIGAGMGGLMAGVNMAHKGKKTLVLEQHNVPGGFATTFVRGNYEFEATLHEMLDVDFVEKNCYVRKILNELGVKCEFKRVPEAYVLIVPDQNLNVCVPFGVDAFINCVEKEVPGIKKSLKKYMSLCKDMYDGINYLIDCDSKGKEPNKILLATKYHNLLKYAHKTVEEVENEYNFPPKAQSIIHAYWCYQGPSIDRLTFTIWGYMLYGYLETGAYIPNNRSHALSLSISERIKELGGQIEFSCKVEKIHVTNNKIQGVELSDGTFIKTNCVFSNAHPEIVYGQMISPKEEVPEFAIQKTNAQINTCSSIAIYLGLNANPKDIGINYYEYFISDTMDTKAIHDSMFTMNPHSFLSAICLDNAIPGATGKDRCQLAISWIVMGDIFKNVTFEDYDNIKINFGEKMIDIFEKTTGAKIRDYIEEIEMVTPITWNRYTGAYKGQIFGYEQTPWDSAVCRLAAYPKEKKQLLNGLYFVGGCSESTHGYTSIIRLSKSITDRALKEMEVIK